jgi:hypothetical protein
MFRYTHIIFRYSYPTLPKASQQPGESEEIPRESSGRDPPGDGACRDSRVAGASQGVRQGRGWPF